MFGFVGNTLQCSAISFRRLGVLVGTLSNVKPSVTSTYVRLLVNTSRQFTFVIDRLFNVLGDLTWCVCVCVCVRVCACARADRVYIYIL